MRTLARLARSLVLLSAAAALFVAPIQPARAGGGGSDLSNAQSALNAICSYLSMNPCPQLPTLTQAALEIAALTNNSPDAVRSNQAVGAPVGASFGASNMSQPPASFANGASLGSFPVPASSISGLNPLAFVGATTTTGSATPTPLSNVNANAFFYAVASNAQFGGTYPDTLLLLYEDLSLTNGNLKPGVVAAKFALPLTRLASGTETPFPVVLNFAPSSANDCSMSTVSGAPFGSLPSTYGIQCAVVFGPTAISSKSHAIFEIAVQLVLTGHNVSDGQYDTGYFTQPSPDALDNAAPRPFTQDLPGSFAGFGIAPAAAPLVECTSAQQSSSTCPPLPAVTYPFCASMPFNGNTSGNAFYRSVASFYTIATSGETLLSTATGTVPCPSGM